LQEYGLDTVFDVMAIRSAWVSTKRVADGEAQRGPVLDSCVASGAVVTPHPSDNSPRAVADQHHNSRDHVDSAVLCSRLPPGSL